VDWGLLNIYPFLLKKEHAAYIQMHCPFIF
jgi:hypothetical protein